MGRRKEFQRRHLEKNKLFFLRVSQAKGKRRLRSVINEAKPQQLRSLILLISAFYLKQLPVSAATVSKLKNSRKKSALKRYFGSHKKVVQLFKNKESWREVLLDLLPVIPTFVTNLYAPRAQ